MLRTLELRSDVVALGSGAIIEDHSDYIMQRTPNQPDFWFGNRLILKRADVRADLAFAAFEAQFPQARHRVFSFDLPGLKADEIDAGFAARGCKLEFADTLQLARSVSDVPLPDGMTVRSLEGDDDWAQSQELQITIGIEDGFDGPTHAAYQSQRTAIRRKQIAAGGGRWFAAFAGNRLVAQMGLIHDSRIARFQDVQTRPDFRNRGIAAAVVRHTALWARRAAPQANVVIVADANSVAGRLYRRMGFVHAETTLTAYLPGY